MSREGIDLAVTIRAEETLRLLGYPPERDPPERIARAFEEALREARALVRPRGVWRRMTPGEAAGVDAPRAATATAFILGLATIGPLLETAVSQAAAAGETVRALLLDSAGSAAVEEAADELSLHALRVRAPGQPGLKPPDSQDRVPCRISPGYGDWPLEAQRLVFARLPHASLGVRLVPSCLMIPRKSVTFGFWLDLQGEPVMAGEGCSRCPLTTCSYRRKESAR